MSMSQLRSQLKMLRNEHAGKPVSKMTEAEIQREIIHHEAGCKARAMKEARMKALEKAREVRMKKKEEEIPEVKVPEIKKKTTKTEHVVPAAPKKEEKEEKKPKMKAKKESSEEVKEEKKPSSRSTKVLSLMDDE